MTAYLKPGDRVVFMYPDRSSADAPDSYAKREAARNREGCERLLAACGVTVIGSIGSPAFTSGMEILIVVRDE